MARSRRGTSIKSVHMEPGFAVVPRIRTPLLFDIVDELIRATAPAARQAHTLLFNEIPIDLEIKTDKSLLSSILREVLNMLFSQTSNGYVRISAKTYSDIMLIHVREFNAVGNWKNASFYSLQPMVKRIRGFLGVTSYRQYETTIALSFPNLPMDADLPAGNGRLHSKSQ
jgi:hypothetical protein